MSEQSHNPRQAQNRSGDAIRAGVARDLSELAREWEAESDGGSVMQRIARSAVREIDGCNGASITLFEHGVVVAAAHTGPVAARIVSTAQDTGEAPGVDAPREQMTVRSDDLRQETRWPAWRAVAVANGVLSVLSFQLFVRDDNMGALNVYGDAPGVFTPEAEETGLLLASHAAVAMAKSRQIHNLQRAVSSRDLIGQAKGILMERFKLSADQAFDLLVVVSQRTHRKLRDVAQELAETGELKVPEPADQPG